MAAPRSGGRILLHATLITLTGFLGSGFLQRVGAGEVQYAYDARGRLAAVTAEDGVTYAYRYDDDGNLTSITPAKVIVSGFAPSRGGANTSVTLQGVGFDGTDPEVRFNGTLAQVVGATATEIETKVPVGATSGPITVSNSLGTAESLVDFLVVGGPPAISDFSPKSGVAGTSVVLQGTGIEDVESKNTVTLNGVSAAVSVSSPSSLTFSVPTGVGSGKIRLETFQPPPATTTLDFLVAPPGYAANLVERGVRAAAFGSPTNVLLSQAGKISLLLFEANAGLVLGQSFGADAGLCTTEILIRPDNTVFPTPGNSHCGTGFSSPVKLDQTGTWTLVLDPNASTTGTRSVTLFQAPDNPRMDLAFTTGLGATGTLAATVPGQVANFLFPVQAGDDMSFIGSLTDANNPPTCLYWRILRPNGSTFATNSCVSGTTFFHDRTTLDTTGVWTVIGGDESPAKIHTYKLQLYKVPADVSTQVSAENTVYEATTSTPGQSARFTLPLLVPAAGQFTGAFLNTRCNGASSATCRVWRIYRPNGTVFGTSSCVATPYTSSPINFTAGVWTFEADEQGPERHCHQFSISLQ